MLIHTYACVYPFCLCFKLSDIWMDHKAAVVLKLFQAEPPQVVVATIGSLCQMLDRHAFNLEALRVLVIDEVIIFVTLNLF